MAARKRVAVVVLGDIGRSPRMQYHALSLANQAGMDVDLVGYGGSTPHRAVLDDPHIHLHLLGLPFSSKLPRLLYLLLLPFKLLLQVFSLLWSLCFAIRPPQIFLLQNPPSIPVLSVVLFASWLHSSSLIIDWHNFGYTLLALRLGSSHILVRIHKWYERTFGRRGDAHLCVTRAMQQELALNWDIKASVLYDGAPEFFKEAILEQKHELFVSLAQNLTRPAWEQPGKELGAGQPKGDEDELRSALLAADWLQRQLSSELAQQTELLDEELTLVTRRWKVLRGGRAGKGSATEGSSSVGLREDRPAVVVSSTSWTADEDIGILLEAALMYDRRVSVLLGEKEEEEEEAEEEEGTGGAKGQGPEELDLGALRKPQSREQGGIVDKQTVDTQRASYPKLLFLITGKGPLRAHWESKLAKLHFKRVAFRTLWLSAEDYPILLGSADLGVSLHISSSGLDLPMKVVDMFGCSLPVCAVAYSCINELVKENQNGLLFSTSSELADQLLGLFQGFPSSLCSPLLSALRQGAAKAASSSRWAQEWELTVLPLIEQLAQRKKERNGARRNPL